MLPVTPSAPPLMFQLQFCFAGDVSEYAIVSCTRFCRTPYRPVFGSCWQVRVCAQVPALHAQQLLWHGAPILFQLFCTIFSLISPQNHVKLADHARDAFGRSSSCPISLCCSLIWGCFVAAACNYYSNIVSKVKGSLPGWFLCFLVACSRVDGGGGFGGQRLGEPMRAVGPRIRLVGQVLCLHL